MPLFLCALSAFFGPLRDCHFCSFSVPLSLRVFFTHSVSSLLHSHCPSDIPPAPPLEEPEARAEYSSIPGAASPPSTWRRHSLRANASFWRPFVRSQLVMMWILHGYTIHWAAAPPAPQQMPNHQQAYEFSAFTTDAVTALVNSGAVAAVSHIPTVVSPLSVVERRGKLRLILDLRYVNSHIVPDKKDNPYSFTFEGINDAPTVLLPGDNMFTVDLESAYHHVDMHPSSWDYLGFSWQGQYYVFRSLPFGLCTAPWVFTKVTRELTSRWRQRGIRLIHYLDDFLFAIGRRSSLVFTTVRAIVLADIRAAGFSLSEEKLELEPSQRRKFLGFIFDTACGIITVSPVRVAEFLSRLDTIRHAKSITKRSLSRLLGQLASMTPVLGSVARVYARACHAALHTVTQLHHHLKLPEDARTEILFWTHRFGEFNSTPLWKDTKVTYLELFSDASDFGWGGHAQLSADLVMAQGYFDPAEQGPLTSSTLREIWALERVLESLLARLESALHAAATTGSTAIRAYVDNQALEYIMVRGSRKPHLNAVIKRIFEFCWKHGITLAVQWVPREENELADHISKFYDHDDWMVNRSLFQELDTIWGPHTVDVFASEKNHLCSKFFSLYHCRGSHGVDAFTQEWGSDNCWINPPFGLIGQVIRHLRRCKAIATLICPYWPQRPWWPILCPDGDFAEFIVDFRELPRSRDLFLPGPKHASQEAVGSPNWRVYALRLDFRSI